MKIKKVIILEILFIFLLSLTPLLWFRPGEIMVGHDNTFPLNPQAFLKTRLYTWTQNEGMGLDQSLIMGSIPIHLIDALPTFFGFSLQATQKVVWIFWFFLIGLSSYILASIINPESRFFKLWIVLFYQFNFFVLQGWWIGERTKFSAYIALPLVLSVLILLIREKITPLKAAVLNSLILFFFNAGSLFGLPLYGGLMIALGLFIFFFGALSILERNYRILWRLVLTIVLSGIGFFLINAYQFFPALLKLASEYGVRIGRVGGLESLVTWAGIISFGASFLNLFRLQGIAEWYDNPQHPYAKYFLNNPLLVSVSFVFPALVLLSLVLIKEREKLKFVLYFFLVYLVGLFFTAGIHPPLGFIYELLMKVIPGFAIFRSPFYKFAPAIFISSAFLSGFTLDYLKSKISQRKILALLFSGFWLASLLAYHFPYFKGEFFHWRDNFSTRLKIPEYVFEFGSWTENKKDDLRILAAPPLGEANHYELYRWGYLSLFPLPRLLTKKSVILNDEMLGENERKFIHLAYESLLKGDKEVFKKTASILRLGWILVREDFLPEFEGIKMSPPKDYRKIIENVFGYPQEKEFGNWRVYKIVDQPILPKIYGAEKPSFATARLEEFRELFSEEVAPQNLVIFENIKEIPTGLIETNYLFPRCLSCEIEEEKIDVRFPPVVLLPDSPFYILVKLKEIEIRKKKVELQVKVFDEVGTSLKRLAEMGRMLEFPSKSDEEKIKAINSYKNALDKIEKTFFKIADPNKRFLVAERLDFYLQAENGKLIDYYGKSMNKEVVENFLAAFWQLVALREEIKPYLFNKDFSANKSFSLFIPQNGQYKVLLKKQNIQEILGETAKISLKIDDLSPINQYKEDSDWLDFGEYTFTKGDHQILLTIPSSPNLLLSWETSKEILPTGVKKCFSSRIENFSNKEKYEVNFFYKNTLFEDMFYFLKEEKEKEEKTGFFTPESKWDLNLRFKESKERFLIFPTEEIKGIQVGFCAENLTEEGLKQIVKKIEVERLISPLLFLKPLKKTGGKIVDVSFQEINPTKYLINVRNAKSPFILTFLEKFSPDWQISPKGEKHFLINGYANGWIFNKPGDYQLSLQYFPQKIFLRGGLVSFATFVLGIFIVLKRK